MDISGRGIGGAISGGFVLALTFAVINGLMTYVFDGSTLQEWTQTKTAGA